MASKWGINSKKMWNNQQEKKKFEWNMSEVAKWNKKRSGAHKICQWLQS